MGNNERIPRVYVCRSGRQYSRQGSQSLARKNLCSQVCSRAEPPAADAKGDQGGVEQHPGVWSSAASAVGWSVPQLYLESGVLHPSGSLDKYLSTCDGKWGITPGAYLWADSLCRYGSSGHLCIYLRWVSLPNMSAVT